MPKSYVLINTSRYRGKLYRATTFSISAFS